MKYSLLIAALLPLCADTLRADTEVTLQELREIGPLPEDKQALRPDEKIDGKKSNPFAERNKPKTEKAEETVETEESKIRMVFDTLRITGIMKSNGKYSALLGDMILEENQPVPPVLPGQTQILRVARVTDKMVELAWVEGAGFETAAPRRILKRVELSPKVAVLLPGQSKPDSAVVSYVDENGKAILPRRAAVDPAAIVGSLPPSSNPAEIYPELDGTAAADPVSEFSAAAVASEAAPQPPAAEAGSESESEPAGNGKP